MDLLSDAWICCRILASLLAQAAAEASAAAAAAAASTSHGQHGGPPTMFADHGRWRGCVGGGLSLFHSPGEEFWWRVRFSVEIILLMRRPGHG